MDRNQPGIMITEILDRIPDAVLLTDGEDRLVDCNEAARRLLGLEEGMRGAPLATVVEWDGAGTPRSDARRTAMERDSWRGEVRLAGAAGHEVRLDWLIGVDRDAGGKPSGTVECVRTVPQPTGGEANIDRLLRAGLDLSLALSRTLSLPEALDACLGAAMAIAGMDSGGVYQVTDAGGLELLTHRGLTSRFVDAVLRYPASDWKAELARRGDPRFAEEGEIGAVLGGLEKEEGLRSLAVVPIFQEGRAVACLAVASHAEGRIPPPVRRMLQEIASRAGMAIAHVRVEELLRESEERFRSITEQLPDAVFLTDSRGAVTYISPAAGRIFGWLPAEMTGRPFTDFLPESERARAMESFAGTIATGHETVDLALEMRRRAGGTFHGEVSASPMRHRGAVVGTLGIIHDVTARRLNESRLAGLLDLAAMAWRPEKELTDAALQKAIELTRSRIGYLAFLNEAQDALTMYSWSREAMRESAAADKPVRYPLSTTGPWGEAVRQRGPIVANDHPADKPWRTGYPEGHARVDRHMNVPLFDGERIVLVAGVGNKEEPYGEDDVRQLTLVMDGMWKILKVHRAEKALRESEARYRFLVQNSSDLFMTLDAGGTVLYISPSVQRMTGCRPSELEGRNVFERIHDEDAEKARSVFQACILLPGTEARLEYRFRHRDGSWLQCEANAVNLLHDPSIGAVLVNVRDVTARARAESERALLREQLQQAMKMEAIGRLAGGVAHDFNNLLTAISGNVSLLQMDLELEEGDPRAETLREVGRAAESAASLTRRLLAFSRKQVVEPKAVRLEALIEEMSRMLARLIGENIELRTVRAPGSGCVRIDPGEMEQILANLAVNSRDAMPEGGVLTIATTDVRVEDGSSIGHPEARPGPYVRLSVTDTGQGMDGEVKKHLFEPFFTTKPKDRGTGLGLATIYGAVKRAGGFIEVESEVGRGTSFRIYLPCIESREEPEAPAVQAVVQAGRETILLVEDEPTLRRLAVRMLQRLGYTVLDAADGAGAVLLAEKRREPIDLLMTDVVMPGMNGRELAERLSKIHPKAAILFMSGYTDDVILRTGALERNLHFLGKPFTIQALSRSVREALDGKS